MNRWGFISGGLKGSHLNWAVADKEVCAILSVCRRLSYLVWDGFDILSIIVSVLHIQSSSMRYNAV